MTPIIKDQDGHELATVEVDIGDNCGVVAVRRVIAGKGRLLKYYFGQGSREARMQLADFLLRGRLVTRWFSGERLWAVRLSPLGATSASEGPTRSAEHSAPV